MGKLSGKCYPGLPRSKGWSHVLGGPTYWASQRPKAPGELDWSVLRGQVRFPGVPRHPDQDLEEALDRGLEVEVAVQKARPKAKPPAKPVVSSLSAFKFFFFAFESCFFLFLSH